MGCQPYYFKRTGAARGDYRPGEVLAIAITKPERIALVCQTKSGPVRFFTGPILLVTL